MTRLEEFDAKLRRVRAFMGEHGYDGVALTTQANFAWLTCGGDDHVAMASEGGVAKVLVTGDAVHLVTNNIEAPRLAAEELGDLPVQAHQFDWHDEYVQTVEKDLVAGLQVASDGGWPAGAKNEALEIARLRWELLEPEIERYRWIGERAALALGVIAQAIEPGMTEHEIASDLGAELLADGMTPAVLLIATDERCYQYRHPIPTGRRLERQAMLVIGARRWGLGVSATRIVHFGEPEAELRRKHVAVCRLDACLIGETRPGAKVKDIFAKAVAMYGEVGYPEEWRNHHQGGPTGYAPRDYKGTLDCPGIVRENQAFAWNPSISGTKSEDTIVARADETEIISPQRGWPMVEAEYGGQVVERPDILVR
jgi:Xaa-Pro aminopeptidase